MIENGKDRLEWTRKVDQNQVLSTASLSQPHHHHHRLHHCPLHRPHLHHCPRHRPHLHHRPHHRLHLHHNVDQVSKLREELQGDDYKQKLGGLVSKLFILTKQCFLLFFFRSVNSTNLPSRPTMTSQGGLSRWTKWWWWWWWLGWWRSIEIWHSWKVLSSPLFTTCVYKPCLFLPGRLKTGNHHPS